MSFEHNPDDDIQPTKEEWEAMELRNALAKAIKRAEFAEDRVVSLGYRLDAVRQLCRNAPLDATIFARQIMGVIQ